MIYERLQLIAVAHIRRRQPPRQILVGLIGIASLRIKIVDRSAKLQATVDITGKIGLQTILRRFPAARRVIAHERHRNARVVKLVVTLHRYPVAYGVAKVKIAHGRPVGQYHIYAGRTEIARRDPRRRHSRGHWLHRVVK